MGSIMGMGIDIHEHQNVFPEGNGLLDHGFGMGSIRGMGIDIHVHQIVPP